MGKFAIFSAVQCPRQSLPAAAFLVDRDIRAFVAGRTDGEKPLHALYDHVLDEPIPDRLLAVFSR